MDIFAPTTIIWPYQRYGGADPVMATPWESGQDQVRRKWTSYPLELAVTLEGTLSEIQTDYNFIVTKGGHTAFKFKDYYAYSVTDESVGSGTGSRADFFTKYPYIANATLVVKVNSVTKVLDTDYTVSNPMEDGKIHFLGGKEPGAGTSVTATYEYYRKMLFVIRNPVQDLHLEYQTLNMWMIGVRMREVLA